MTTYRIGDIVGSLSTRSINRRLVDSIINLGSDRLEFFEIPLVGLPFYNHDFDADYPKSGRDLKAAIESADGILIVTPEYNRSIPGVLKNALDLASRPWGTNSFAGKPVAVAGASIGAVGTAVAQAHLRTILGFFDAVVMGQPEAYIQLTEDSFDPTGVPSASLAAFLRTFTGRFEDFVQRHAAAKGELLGASAA